MTEKILVVDDDKEFRSEFKEFLEGYDVMEAANGTEALDILKRAHEISLVVLDVRMPGPSGTEVLREIRKIDPNLGIIILTGHSSKEVVIEALKGHADDYVEKPLDVLRIKEVIEKVLDSKRGESDIYTPGLKGKIEKIKRFTERNCYKKIGLKEAADVLYMSPKYFSRVFKQQTGMSYSQYKLRIKADKAKELLAETGFNVNQIANKLGYENSESFIRQFKKITKTTPTEYRKKAQSKKKR